VNETADEYKCREDVSCSRDNEIACSSCAVAWFRWVLLRVSDIAPSSCEFIRLFLVLLTLDRDEAHLGLRSAGCGRHATTIGGLLVLEWNIIEHERGSTSAAMT
jgi:hypothetical protein